jgi:hypothetical protein
VRIVERRSGYLLLSAMPKIPNDKIERINVSALYYNALQEARKTAEAYLDAAEAQPEIVASAKYELETALGHLLILEEGKDGPDSADS